MKPSLQLRQSQQLTLTPQLQQSIKLLQMSTLELSQEIEQALADNPMLERSDDPLDAALRIEPNGALNENAKEQPAPTEADTLAPDTISPNTVTPDTVTQSESAEPSGDQPGDQPVIDSPTDPDFSGAWEGSGGGGSATRGDNPDDESDYAQLGGTEPSLREHLSGQLGSTAVSDQDRVLLELLIDELDEHGYLGCSTQEFLELLPQELELEEEDITAVLRLLQSFDPPGVGARDLRECLLLQLELLARDAPDDEEKHDIANAQAIVTSHLELLAARDFTKLRRSIKCSEDELKAAQQVIVGLVPRPGANFASDEPNYVVPDVVVKRDSEKWAVSLNPNVLPKLRVNAMYADVLKQHRGASSDLSGQLQEARWLIKNIQQRFETILRVSQAIVDRQKAFFSHGEVGMRPLVLREIADTLELHESTVSRVTTHKYMLTPHGTFELKYFFGSHVATDSGGAASSTAIRALLKQVIAAEDSKKPLSDNRIAQLLAEQGFVVARRTIAKYRESLRIPPVSQRKTL
jgi:RNA polymerase sigma-54 factor